MLLVELFELFFFFLSEKNKERINPVDIATSQQILFDIRYLDFHSLSSPESEYVNLASPRCQFVRTEK